MYLHKDDRELLLDIINTVSNISGVRTASSPYGPVQRRQTYAAATGLSPEAPGGSTDGWIPKGFSLIQKNEEEITLRYWMFIVALSS